MLRFILYLLVWLSVGYGAQAMADQSSDSTNIKSLQHKPDTIITLETGYIDWPTSGTVKNIFTTQRICPSQFMPYITLVPTKINQDPNGEHVVGSFGVCVQSVQTNGQLYNVVYLAAKNYSTVTQNTYPERYTAAAGAYTAFSTEELPSDSSVTASTTPDTSGVGGLRWILYCYPPNQTPPAFSVDCVEGKPPF